MKNTFQALKSCISALIVVIFFSQQIVCAESSLSCSLRQVAYEQRQSTAGDNTLAQLNKLLGYYGLHTENVQAFVSQLDAPVEDKASDELLGQLGWPLDYVSGIFTRNDIESEGFRRVAGDYDYCVEDADPVIEKMAKEIARAVLNVGEPGKPLTKAQAAEVDSYANNVLRVDSIKAIYRLIFNARDTQGRLIIGNEGEITFFRWSYRGIFDLLFQRGIPGTEVSGDQFRALWADPLQPYNYRGNDEIRELIATELMKMEDKILFDDEESLSGDPTQVADHIVAWCKYMAAANNIDYTKPDTLAKIEAGTFNVSEEVSRMAKDEMLAQLGGEIHIRDFIARYVTSGTQAVIVIAVDNNQEVDFWMKFSEVCLTVNPSLTIRFVAKQDNRCLNDASINDVNRELREEKIGRGQTDIFGRLRRYQEQKRFMVLEQGPTSQGLPRDRCPRLVAEAIRDADVVLLDGEALFWTLANGLTHKRRYFLLKLKWRPFVNRIAGITAAAAKAKPTACFVVDKDDPICFRGLFVDRTVRFPGESEAIPVAQSCVRDVLLRRTAPNRSHPDSGDVFLHALSDSQI